jgi:hypothetical protein
VRDLPVRAGDASFRASCILVGVERAHLAGAGGVAVIVVASWRACHARGRFASRGIRGAGEELKELEVEVEVEVRIDSVDGGAPLELRK